MTTQEYVLEKCSDNLKVKMAEALIRYKNPQVFQTGFMSSEFRLDREALKFGWTNELQYEYWSIMFDPMDIESNYI